MHCARVFRTTISFAAVVAVATAALPPRPAFADRKGFGFGVGVGVGVGAILNELSRGGQRSGGGGGHRSHSKPDKGDDDDSSSDKSDEKTNDQRAADERNFARQKDEMQEREKTARVEVARNVDLAVARFVNKDLKERHEALRLGEKDSNVKAAGNGINQVTIGEVKRAVEAAYKSEHLDQFEKFAGELWTRDRLMVRILQQSRKELDVYFQGVGVKGVSMDDIKGIFVKSAQHVYGQALQIAEMMGVSYSFDRLIRTVFEHSGAGEEANQGATANSDGRYERLVTSVVDTGLRYGFVGEDAAGSSEVQLLDRQFTYRFRARRVIYDCIAASYGDILTGGNNSKGGSSIQASDRSTPGGRTMPASQNSQAPTTAGVWPRVTALVNTKCSDPLKVVANDARSDKLLPKPVRWDSSGNGSPLGHDYLPVVPAGGALPK